METKFRFDKNLNIFIDFNVMLRNVKIKNNSCTDINECDITQYTVVLAFSHSIPYTISHCCDVCRFSYSAVYLI